MANSVAIGGSGTLFVGEDKTLRLEVLDVASVPVDIAGWVMVFDVRKKDKSAEPPIVTKTPTIVGTYNAVRATNTQRAQVVLTDTDLNLFKEATYRYSWKRLEEGLETVLAWGNFTPQKATAP